MKTKLTAFIAALLLWTALPSQAQFHAELGYRYGLGLNEQMLGECVYRDQYKMYSNTILLNFMYDITPQMSAGAGVGFTLCETGSHGSLPVYATFRYSPLKKVPGFYAFTDLGYAPPIGPGKSITWSMGQEQTRYEGLNYGWLWDLGVGYRIMFRKHFGLNFQLCYNLQQFGGTNILVNNEMTQQSYYDISDNLRHSLSAGIALVF